MARIVVRRYLLVPLLLTLLLVGSLPVMARPSRPAQTNLPAQCFPRQDAQDDLTIAEISALFDTVIRPAGSYQGYDFALDVENTPPDP